MIGRLRGVLAEVEADHCLIDCAGVGYVAACGVRTLQRLPAPGDEAEIEEIFVNMNPGSTLKLSHARAAVMLAPARAGLSVAEYAPNMIKKTVVGAGHADKSQIAFMVKRLLPQAGDVTADAADALAVAITHANLRVANRRVA